MQSSAEFVHFILSGGEPEARKAKAIADAALPDGMVGFDDDAEPPASVRAKTSFARRLLEAAGFGLAQLVERSSVIRSSDAVAKYLPERASYWPKTATRPYQTLLFEATMTSAELLKIPAFRNTELRHLEDVEAALARLVSEALDGFQRGGEGVTADVRKGRPEETLCIVSILDQREAPPVRLVCFGTQNKQTQGLETFQITERARSWELQLAREHLGLLYERQFKKLATPTWQEAFTTTEERKQAAKLLDVCTRKSPSEHDIQEGVLDLLDTIARGFGLPKKAKTERRLQAYLLPADHDIGIDPDKREKTFGGKNPFGGVTLRDERSRLLGYIVYPLKSTADAALLREHLKKNNRFHNVLVVYPDQDQASLELWQGDEQLTGKLRKDQGYTGVADVVNLLSRFFIVSKAKVKNPAELAQELAYRARYLRRLAVKQLEDEPKTGPLRNLYKAFREALVHDQTADEFADAFAQTLTYSLLTSRWILSAQGTSGSDRFTRKAAMQRLAIGSRFLGEMFEAVLAMNLDERARLLWLVDDVADLLDRVDVVAVFTPDGTDLTADPIIHFYEPFLKEYDSKIRMQRGAFYTPQPAVSYIVRSVHELLQTEFGLADGLADTTTWGEMVTKQPGLKLPPLTDEPGEKRTISADEPFVQILDPATGTATFLVEVIDVVYRTLVSKWSRQRLTDDQQQSAWNDYVPTHLLPRLHAFELMMAPYAIAHMKVGLKLAETGYHFGAHERAHIYLTNALEPWVKQLPLIGFDALAREAAAVNEIKRRKRFTVVIGNPPYAGHSTNKGEWITRLVDEYYHVDGSPLGERNPKWLQDDYVKCIRLGQECVRQSGTGIFSFITNHGYIDNPTFRGMRQSFMRQFPRVAVLDLHGNTTKRESAPDGGKDENVFDIKQGVAIFVARFLMDNDPITLTQHAEIYGLREQKYSELNESTHLSRQFSQVSPSPPFYLLLPQDVDLRVEYDQFQTMTSSFPVNVLGFQTHRDNFAVDLDMEELKQRIAAFRGTSMTETEVKEAFKISDNSDWNVRDARARIRADRDWKSSFMLCSYRPFDSRPCYFSAVVMDRPRRELLDHVAGRENVCIGLGRQGIAVQDPVWSLISVSRSPVDANIFRRGGINVFPLYLYPQDNELGLHSSRRPNFSRPFLVMLAASLHLPLGREDAMPTGLTPEDVFHYVYAVFHSPGYRSRYSEFLKIDFPRLPISRSLELFLGLAHLGSELAALHMLELPKLGRLSSEFTGERDPKVEKISWSRETVWVDKAQSTGFRGVREDVWNFHVGGYQVCHKWLKDRKGRTLTKDDIEHYQKIVVAISETIRIMKEIDQVIDKHGGWPNAFVTKSSGATK